MSATLDLSTIAEQLLQMPGALSADVPVMVREKGKPANDIVAAINAREICVYVMPAFPLQAMQGVDVVFYEKAELRVRIQEKIQLNWKPVNAYDLVDQIAVALHWQPTKAINAAVIAKMAALSCDQTTAFAAIEADPAFASLLALGRILRHPLQIAGQPAVQIEDLHTRIIDVIFNATYEIQS